MVKAPMQKYYHLPGYVTVFRTCNQYIRRKRRWKASRRRTEKI